MEEVSAILTNMPRTTSEPEIDEFARAGGLTRSRMMAQADDDRRFQAQQERQMRNDARLNAREDRMLEGADLDNEVKRWEFEKKKALDRNAALMKIETDKAAIAANEELFKINTADDDAQEKLADWGARHFRVLDQNTGDPRLIRQFQINQTRAENRAILKMRADELRGAREAKDAEKRAADEERKARLADAAASGMVRESVTVDGERYAKPDATKEPKTEPDTYEKFQRDITAARKTHGIPTAKEAKDQLSLPPEIQKAFEERGAKLSPSSAAPSATAHPMEGQIVKQKSTGKTGRIVNGQFVAQ